MLARIGSSYFPGSIEQEAERRAKRHPERSEGYLFDCGKRGIPHLADSVRNNEFAIVQHSDITLPPQTCRRPCLQLAIAQNLDGIRGAADESVRAQQFRGHRLALRKYVQFLQVDHGK